MSGVSIGPNGSLFITDQNNGRIRLVVDGLITTVAGTGSFRFSGDGGLATQAELTNINDAQVGPDGSLYIWGSNSERVRKVAPFLPGVAVDDFVVAAEDGSEVYVFTNSGRHLRTLNALTGAVRYQFGYDSVGQLISITDGDGNATAITRDASGHPTALIAPGGQRTTLTVDANSYLATVTNPANERVQLSYTAEGLLVTQTDPKGGLHRYGYDALGRLIRDEDPAGGVQTLARVDTPTGHTVTRTTALGRTSTYQVEHLPTGAIRRSVTQPSGAKTVALIGTDGSKQTAMPDGSATTVQYGPDPRFGMQAPVATSVILKTPAGRTRTITTTRTAMLSDPNNLFSLTKLTDTVTDNGVVSTREYDGTSRVWTGTTADGRSGTLKVDALGRMTQVQTAGLAPVDFAYDGHGLLSTVTEGAGATSRTTNLTYNSARNLSGISDALGRSVGFAYDLAERLTKQTLPDSRTIQYSYDAAGNAKAITPPGRPAHGFAYTPIDQMSSYTPPNVGPGSTATQYIYNADRALTRLTRPDGQVVDLTYDAAGRTSTLKFARGLLNYTYSATTAKLIGVTAPGGIDLGYSYDGALLTGVTWSGSVSGTTAYTYNNDFRVTTEKVNGANSVSFAYDADGLLTMAGSLSLTHNAQNGLLTGTTLGGVTDIVSYTDLAELKDYSVVYGGSGMYSVGYVQDAIGRITQKIETIAGATATYGYTYDPAGRLSGVTKNGTTATTYTYDSNGNRTGGTGPSGTVSATYDNQDRLLTYGSASYSYTANGELLSKTAGTQTTRYQYEALGNLLNVTLPNGTVIDYLIDGRNRRIGKKVNGTLIQAFLYQGSLRPIAELDGSNTIVSRFVYATRSNVPDYMVKGGITYRIITDHLGSPRSVIDVATGTVAQRMDYDEFGTVLQDTHPGFQPFGFAGGLYDHDTKLVRFGARDYDADTGRWTAKDPIGFAGRSTNVYTYVGNNSVNLIDPSGLYPNIVEDWGPLIPAPPAPPGHPFYGNYCGPGNLPGAPISSLDAACKDHDECYDKAGLSAHDVSNPSSLSSEKKDAKRSCDARLVKKAQHFQNNNNPGLKAWLTCVAIGIDAIFDKPPTLIHHPEDPLDMKW